MPQAISLLPVLLICPGTSVFEANATGLAQPGVCAASQTAAEAVRGETDKTRGNCCSPPSLVLTNELFIGVT